MDDNSLYEQKRLDALKQYDIMDTVPEEELNALVKLASEVCKTPIALISLVDDKRQWFKAKIGLSANETPRSISLCQYAIEEGNKDVYEVPDALENELLANNPLVTGNPNLRFYAGAPLITDKGYSLGTLCVLDTKPKQLNAQQKETLQLLSKLVITYFELRKNKVEIENSRNAYLQLIEQSGDVIYTNDLSGNFDFISSAIKKLSGYAPEELLGKHYLEIVAPEWRTKAQEFYLRQSVEGIKETAMEFPIITKNNEQHWVEVTVVLLFDKDKIKGFQGSVRDISKRKEVEKELMNADELFSVIFHASPVAKVLVLAETNQYVEVNNAFTELTGYSREEIIGNTPHGIGLVTSTAQSNVAANMNTTGKVKDWAIAYTTKQGEKRDLMVSGEVVLINGRKHRLYTCTDVTVQNQIQRALKERDERFTKIFNSLPAAMVLSTLNPNKFLEANKSFTELTGYTKESIIGKNSAEIGFFTEEQRNKIAEDFAHKGFLKNIEVEFVNDKKEKKYLLFSTELVEIGNVMHALSVYFDITPRKQYEMELINARAMLADAMSIGKLGSFENNIITKEITWSKEIYEMFEMPFNTKQLYFDDFANVIHPDEVDTILNRIQNTVKRRENVVNTNRFITAKGNLRWIEIRAVPIANEKGEVAMVRGTMQDITERKQLEEDLRKAKELAEQSAIAKEEFLANMSHEIRTPINGVIGFTDLLEKTKLNKEQKEFVNAVSISGKNLLSVVNNILDYSKIDSGMMDIEEIPLSIRSLFSSLEILFSQRAKEKKLKLNFDAAKNIPEVVIGDPARLTQVFTNLVGNALKFTEKGGITVSASLVKEDKKNVRVKFYVRDTGIGIAKNKLNTVFERFSQGSHDINRKYGGTGLGLSIVKKLVELHHGKISIKSKLGKGSVFEFSILFKAAQESLKNDFNEKDKKGNKRNKIGKLNVLLVEDNKVNQKLAAKVLQNFGFASDIAENGKLAVALLKKGKYDLIIMDMQMPVMDGYEATSVIRNKLKNNTPIIAMTAHALGSEKDKCLRLGMNDYIAKPFKADTLYAAIEAIFSETKEKPTKPEKNVKMATKGKTALDLTQLKELSENNSEFIFEILSIFIKETSEELVLIKNAINSKDYITIKNLTHKQRSSLSLIGLGNSFDSTLANIEEKAVQKKDIKGIGKLFDTYSKVCKKVIAEAKKEIVKYSK